MREPGAHGVLTGRGLLFENTLAGTGVLLWLLFLVPPLSTWSSQYEFVQATQFCCFALIVPVLLVLGCPWRLLRLASGETLEFDSDGRLVAPTCLRHCDRVALRRTRRQGSQRIVVLLFAFMAFAIAWRLSPVMGDLARFEWLKIIESVTLIGAGTLLWLELVDSRPMSPTSSRLYRIGAGAVAMWTVWVLAYVIAMTRTSWQPIPRTQSLVLSTWADQQLGSALMWFCSAIVFVPVIFSNLFAWLKDEENPSEELYRLVRQEKARGFFGPKI